MPTKQSIRLTLYLVLVMGFAGLLAFKAVILAQSNSRMIGFHYLCLQMTKGIIVNELQPGLPADLAGLRLGDLILEVDGKSLANPNHTSYDNIARNFRRGRAVVFRVWRGGTTLDLRIVPGIPTRWGMFLLEVFTALCFFAVMLLALPQALNRDLRARVLLGYVGLPALLLGAPLGEPVGWPWLRMIIALAFILSTSLLSSFELHLAELINESPLWLRKRPWIIPLQYGISLGLGLIGCITYLTAKILGMGFDFFPWTLEEVEFWQTLPISSVQTLAAIALLAKQSFYYPEPKGRNQARLLLVPMIISMLPLVGATPDSITASLIGLIYSVAFFVVIFHYDLFDIELVVRRSIVYTALTTTLVLIFFAAQGAGAVFFSYVLNDGNSAWAVSLATLLLGFLFVPLRRFLDRLIGEHLFPERYDLRRKLVALAGELPAFGKLPRMGEHLVARIRDLFLARSASLLIADPEAGLLRSLAATDIFSNRRKEEASLLLPFDAPAIDSLRRSKNPLLIKRLVTRSVAFAQNLKGVDPASLMVPLFYQEKLVGALIMGPKVVGTYSAEEMDLLRLLAHHAAIVFENVRLFESATYEGLTGLARREAILEKLERELERAQRYGRPLAVAMADLDHFKTVNDRYGHLAGDALLRQVSQVIASELRGTDEVGRYGGEEFLVFFPETDIEQAGLMAERIRSQVERTEAIIEGGGVVKATISIGLASLTEVAAGKESITARDLIAAADRSLYHAKECGRNCVYPLMSSARGDRELESKENHAGVGGERCHPLPATLL